MKISYTRYPVLIPSSKWLDMESRAANQREGRRFMLSQCWLLTFKLAKKNCMADSGLMCL